MSRTPARFTQADVARCIRAVQQCEADMRVRLVPDGTIFIEKDIETISEAPCDLPTRREIRL